MREIKFRVWDLSISKYRASLTLSANTGAICSSNPEHYVLEQFTGLHDKNGKEIYEGDILSQGETRFIVKWDDKWQSMPGGNYEN